MTDQTDLIRRLAYALDACLVHLDQQAERERRAEEGKPVRQITKQERAKMAHLAVTEAFDLLGIPEDER